MSQHAVLPLLLRSAAPHHRLPQTCNQHVSPLAAQVATTLGTCCGLAVAVAVAEALRSTKCIAQVIFQAPLPIMQHFNLYKHC